MEYFLVFGGLLLTILIVIPLIRGIDRLVENSVQKEIDRLESDYPDIFGGEYKFYTNNHPYVWGELTPDEFVKVVKHAATGPRGVPIDPPAYSKKIDLELKRFYIAPHKKNYNFDKLMHYQEWIDSHSEVAKNIVKYKRL